MNPAKKATKKAQAEKTARPSLGRPPGIDRNLPKVSAVRLALYAAVQMMDYVPQESKQHIWTEGLSWNQIREELSQLYTVYTKAYYGNLK